ncbi:hypothetical protein [Streptomyces sp. NPDC056707]|uniref:hypothetical protein n=1 Tax=Streptomyces sp. NPDC056707 TaxID=3345919 RepID=UPI00368B7CEC
MDFDQVGQLEFLTAAGQLGRRVFSSFHALSAMSSQAETCVATPPRKNTATGHTVIHLSIAAVYEQPQRLLP